MIIAIVNRSVDVGIQSPQTVGAISIKGNMSERRPLVGRDR